MRIQELHLQNFRGFKDLKITFPKSNVAVFIGVNGVGKSSILNAIAILLTQIVAKLCQETPRKVGILLAEDDINIASDLMSFT